MYRLGKYIEKLSDQTIPTKFNIPFYSFTESLRAISVGAAKEFDLLPGQKIYTDCRKMICLNSCADDTADDEDYKECSISKKELNSSIDSLGCSPVKLIAHIDRAGYGKRKLAEIGNAAQAKIASALRLDTETFSEKADTA